MNIPSVIENKNNNKKHSKHECRLYACHLGSHVNMEDHPQATGIAYNTIVSALEKKRDIVKSSWVKSSFVINKTNKMWTFHNSFMAQNEIKQEQPEIATWPPGQL